MIRLASKSDLDEIMDMIKPVVKVMNAQGNDQWSSDYPLKEDFAKDVEQGTLSVFEEDGKILGIICVDGHEPEEYKGVTWPTTSKCLVVHRMAVSLDARGLGVGKKLLKHAETLASEKQIKYLKTDTYSVNPAMNALFKKLGYEKTGEINFKGRANIFYCYAKQV